MAKAKAARPAAEYVRGEDVRYRSPNGKVSPARVLGAIRPGVYRVEVFWEDGGASSIVGVRPEALLKGTASTDAAEG